MTENVSRLGGPVLAWYRARSRRDRQALAVLVAFCGACAIIYGLWLPVESRLSAARRAYGEQSELWQWMQEKAPRVKENAASSPGHDMSTPLPSVLTASASENAIAVKRLEIGEQGDARLVLEQLSFNRLVSWLDGLERTQGVILVSATIGKTETPGLVNADIRLRR